LDNILQELKARFSNRGELLRALEAAENLSLNADDYKYFEEIGVEIPSLEGITVARNYVEKKRSEFSEASGTKARKERAISLLYMVREAFQNVYSLLVFCDTFGCSTAIYESSFSALTQIDIPQRQCMTTRRPLNLTLLSWEKKLLMSLEKTTFLRKFHSNRRLQLF